MSEMRTALRRRCQLDPCCGASFEPEHREGVTPFIRFGGTALGYEPRAGQVVSHGALQGAGAVTVEHETHGLSFAEQLIEEGVNACDRLVDAFTPQIERVVRAADGRCERRRRPALPGRAARCCAAG